MKKIFFLIAVTFALISCGEKAKDSFTIHGNIEGLSTGMVYLGYAQGDDYITDSAVVKDGEFTLEGKVKEPVIGYLQVTDSKGLNLVVENADIEISGNAASPDDIQIKGGKVQQEFDAYQASTKDLRDAQKPITEALMKARETGDEAAFNEQMAKGRELDKKMIEANRKYIQEHPASYVSLHLLYMMSEGLELEELEEMYGGMDASYQNSMAGKSIASRIKAIKNTSVGATAMDFAQTDTEGNTVKLSDLRGKYVLLDFWASWCVPCRAENPNVLKAYNTFKDKNFTVPGVSLDMNEQDWRDAIKEDGMPWTQLWDVKGPEADVVKMYGITGIPASFLIGPDGVIIAKDLRGEELSIKLAEVLN